MNGEIWIADFEYISREGENPLPVCFCAMELNTGKKIRQWLFGETNPEALINFSNPDLTYVAFYSIAEISCHLVLGWAIPENIIDLFCEYRVLTNAGDKVPSSLLCACQSYGINTIDQSQKDTMRDRILQGEPYTAQDKEDILNYCESDIVETTELFKKMHPLIDSWDRALFRGKYMSITAMIENTGVPIDTETLNSMRENWEVIKSELIKSVNADFGFYDGLTFKTQAFIDYLLLNKMSWAYTDNGNLKLDDETWKEMVMIYPQLQPVREVRSLLGRFKNLNVSCGTDGKNRGMLSPFSTKTGRNAPRVQCIFTNPSWLRCLIKPREGEALAYIDYEQQEFFVASILSNDTNMQKTYQSGDPYLHFAKLAGAIPADGTKKTHKAIRDLYKQSCLAIQYGMRAQSLSIRINRPLAYAHELIKQHQRLFPKYWQWQDDVIAQAKLNKRVQTIFGWQMKVLKGTPKEDLTLGNFLMQATGADILRIASYLLTEAGIKIIAPVHDALMISVNLETADQDIKRAEDIMREASIIVLGQPLRTETLTIKYPDRYIDERGKYTWEKVNKILQGIQDGTINPNYDLMGSKWSKHAEKLNRMSHRNLTNWYDGFDKDTIDFAALKDSELSGTENRKNLKGMWKEYL